MDLTKQQKVLAIGGGVLGVGVLVLGYFLYSAWDERSESENERARTTTDHNDLYNKTPFACPATIAATQTNTASFAKWYTNATEFVSRGDRVFASKNGSDFKDDMVKVVKQLAELPGGADGRIVKLGAPEANFGFDEYLGDNGKIPGDDDVPQLAIQLDTVRTVVELFSEAGVMQVNSIRRVVQKPDAEQESRDKNNRRDRRGDKGGKDKKADNPGRTSLDYTFEVTTRPARFVAMLNRLTAHPRFFVVKNLEFKESADMILERIQAAEAAAKQKLEAASSGASASTGRRRRRMMAQAEEPAAKDEPKVDRVVVDPEVDAPLRVKFDLTVYDFGRGAELAEQAAAEASEAKPEGEKPAEKKNDQKEGK